MWKWLIDLLEQDDGFFVATEKILLLTLTIVILVVGISSVQVAASNFVLDEFDRLAACSNLYVFDTASPFYRVRTTDDFDALFPNLATSVTRPVPTPAEKEQD